eukprot:403925_1
MTPSSQSLEQSNRGLYCIHKQTQTESLLGSFSRMFKKMTLSNNNNNDGEEAIIQHLLSDIIDWGSYRYSRIISNSLNITPSSYRSMWKEQLILSQNKPSLINVHKLQLLKSISPKQYLIYQHHQYFILYVHV